jgi:hypothetical protein
MAISVRELTSYQIGADGKSVELRMKDDTGREHELSFKLAELGNLVLTLPGLIEAALRRQIRDTSFRFTYPMGTWSIEQASDPSKVIVTLRTDDGFGVSFSMASSKAQDLGSALRDVETARMPVLAH